MNLKYNNKIFNNNKIHYNYYKKYNKKMNLKYNNNTKMNLKYN